MVAKGTPRGEDHFTEVFQKEEPKGVEVKGTHKGSTAITFWSKGAVALVASPGDWFLVRLYKVGCHDDIYKLAMGTARRIARSGDKGGIKGMGLYVNSLMKVEAKPMTDVDGDMRVYARYIPREQAA